MTQISARPATVATTFDVAGVPAGAAGHTRIVEADLERRWLQHTGLLEEICRYAMLPAGKLFRPVLLIESALAVGGRLDTVLPAAVGTECGHVASLIHDDIIDDDDMRRGRPSVRARFGDANAIVAGDLLIFRLFHYLADCHDAGASAERVTAALRATAMAGVDLCLGQAMESELTGRLDCREEEYVEMASLKTGALFRGACEVGGLLGGGTRAQAAALARYGHHLGIGFQICDDLLGYLSDPATTGKAATSDLRNHRLTLPLILLLRQGGDDGRRLIERAFAEGSADVAAVTEALHHCGAVPAAQQIARDHCDIALEQLRNLPETIHRDALSSFAHLAVRRVC